MDGAAPLVVSCAVILASGLASLCAISYINATSKGWEFLILLLLLLTCATYFICFYLLHGKKRKRLRRNDWFGGNDDGGDDTAATSLDFNNKTESKHSATRLIQLDGIKQG